MKITNTLALLLSLSSVNSLAFNSTLYPSDLSFAVVTKCNNADEVSRDISYSWWFQDKTEANKQGVLKGLSYFKNLLKQDSTKESFMYQDGNIVGWMWVGAMLQNEGFANNVISVYENEVNTYGFPKSAYIEYKTNEVIKSFGIYFTTTGSLADAQNAVKKWSSNQIINSNDGSKTYKSVPVCYLKYRDRKAIVNDERAGQCFSYNIRGTPEEDDLPARLNLDAESLQGYNPNVDFTTLQIDQRICYSVGK